MSKLRKQTLDGNIETMLLAVLLDGPSYGYQIVEDLNKRAAGRLGLGEGTVYPVLHRIEKRGLIQGSWRTGENGRRRKYYRITPVGREALTENQSQFQSLVRIMQGILRSPISAEAEGRVPELQS
jgi:PadR family transcriptional regulator, regulatory protein PadR